MKVQDLLNQLALGELSNLSMAEGDVIAESRIPKIINYANEGLLRLYTKYVLKEQTLILEMQEAVTFYYFQKKFAYSQYDPENPPSLWNMPYIMDLNKDPFEEDVIKVLSVYGSTGCQLPLNDLEQPYSVFTPQSGLLQVPQPEVGKMLSVEYQAKHLTIPNTEYADFNIELPECLHAALRAYIASKVFLHMNSTESTVKGQEHEMMFQMECQSVIDNDLVCTSSSTTNSRFAKRGWA